MTELSFLKIFILACIQGAAELLPVSSSAHVIVAEKVMGLDPSAPEMTFLLVMLHTGTMFAVLLYFRKRWIKWGVSWNQAFSSHFLRMSLVATAVTGVVGLGLKKGIEKLILVPVLGESKAEIEHLFKSLPLVAGALFCAGLLIIYAGIRVAASESAQEAHSSEPSSQESVRTLRLPVAAFIGLIQGLCLPFRGFSRSGATISVGMLKGVSRALAEDFSFALAVWVTPPVIALELHRLLKAKSVEELSAGFLAELVLPGLVGMIFSFATGFLALRWLSGWLESGKWRYFGYYCIGASILVLLLHVGGVV